MIKHIVLFKMKGQDGIARENALMVKGELEALKGKIPEILFLEVGMDVVGSPLSYHLSLYTEFQDLESLRIYQQNPDHQKVLALVNQLAESRVMVDYQM